MNRRYTGIISDLKKQNDRTRTSCTGVEFLWREDEKGRWKTKDKLGERRGKAQGDYIKPPIDGSRLEYYVFDFDS